MATKTALFEKFTNDIKRIWNRAPRGLILWNLFMVLLLTLPILIDLRIFIFAQAIGSFFAFGIMLDNDLANTSSPRNIWTLATAFSWVMLVFMLVFGILNFAYRWTFGRLIEKDEQRLHLIHREELKKKYEHLMLEQGKTEEQLKIEAGEKKNQKLLGN